MKTLVFTDLDGTLLDADTYSPADALEALRTLVDHQAIIVFTSSKTRAEQEPLRAQLDICDPYIVENGSAILFADDQRHVLGLPAAEVRSRLAQVSAANGWHLRGYADCTVEEVATVTGLGYAAAERAQQRDYSETLITPLDADRAERLRTACEAAGLRSFSGGRFYTVTGAGADKGAAVRWLTDYYRARFGALRTFGIGDSANDLPMLTAVDRGYLVQRPNGAWLDVVDVPVTRVRGIGPHGFSAAARDILKGIT